MDILISSLLKNLVPSSCALEPRITREAGTSSNSLFVNWTSGRALEKMQVDFQPLVGAIYHVEPTLYYSTLTSNGLSVTSFLARQAAIRLVLGRLVTRG